MTSSSWEHQREVRDALATIVADPQLGVPALSSAPTMSNLLKDLLPDAPRETSVLVAAAEAGIAQILLDHVGQGMDIATASSLAASAFAARTPFTTDACNWAVGELSVALGLGRAGPPAVGRAPAAGAHGGPPPGGFRPPRQAPTTVDAGDRAETIVPGRDAGRGAGWATPGYGAGYGPPGARPGAPAGPGASPAAPPGARPAAAGAPPGAGYRYPPPPAPPARAGYAYPPPAAPAAGPGYAYPPPAVPSTGPGQAGLPRPGRRTPKAWMIVTAAVVIVALIGGVVALVRRNSGSGTTIEPLSKLLKPDVVSCTTTKSLDLKGLTHREACTTDVSTIKLFAYQFGTASEYTTGLSKLNTTTGWKSSAAGRHCPPPPGTTHARTLWHSNVNAKYRPRAGQILECYPFSHGAGFLLYLWTLPTQRVIIIGFEFATGTFADLEKWWSGLDYG